MSSNFKKKRKKKKFSILLTKLIRKVIDTLYRLSNEGLIKLHVLSLDENFVHLEN